MGKNLSIWLTCIILLTIAAVLAVFRPITFSPRKDPSDASKYLATVGVSKGWDPSMPPEPYVKGFVNGNGNLFLYKPVPDLRLGLDLRGGMRVVLQIPKQTNYTYTLKPTLADPAAATKMQAALADALSAKDALGDDVKDPEKISVNVNEQQAQVTTQADNKDLAQAQEKIITAAMTKVFGTGKFDEATNLNDWFKEDAIAKRQKDAQSSVRTIIGKRLNSSGLTEVTANDKSNDQVELEIPGVKDPDQVQKLLATTAKLQFRLLPADMQVGESKDSKKVVISEGGKELTDDQVMAKSYLVISGDKLDPNCGVTNDPNSMGTASQNGNGGFAVSFNMVDAASKAVFGKATGDNIGRNLAIVLDGKVISAPVIQAKIDDHGIITGNFDSSAANNLATLLNAGAMPVPVHIIENRTVSATLGAASVHLSMLAGVIGLAAVLIFMFAYYRLPGLMADLALVIYICLSLAVLKFFDATLTLPGIAGIIISIGMAVDANVIIFERLKEELRTQKPLETAIDVAFSRAWTAILDSNVASLITGSVLWMLGEGAIKGFAITLVIGVAVSMFTAVTITRLFMKLMIRSKAGHKLSWYGV